MSRPPSGSEQFLILPENRFAYTGVVGWLEPKTTHGVYLYGPSGVGKSHLARFALRQRVGGKTDVKFRHLTASDFAAEFAAASSAREIPKFQAGFRDLDCLILEDIQSLENRPETQQQLLAVMNDLSGQGAKVLWTSRKSPGELESFLPKLTSRFHGGVTALMRMPSVDSRASLLDHFAATRGVPLSNEQTQRIARALPVSPRELLAVVLQVEQHAKLESRRIDAPLVRQVLLAQVPPKRVRMEDIARVVAKHFEVTLAELRAPGRTRNMLIPRQCAMLLARELTNEGLARIGKFFRRNHSTVVHGCDRMEQLLSKDDALRVELAQIRAALGVTGDANGDS